MCKLGKSVSYGKSVPTKEVVFSNEKEIHTI